LLHIQNDAANGTLNPQRATKLIHAEHNGQGGV
jgi:hypothetical protein